MIQYHILSVSSFLMIYKTTKFIMIFINFYSFYFRVKMLINLYTQFFHVASDVYLSIKTTKSFHRHLFIEKKNNKALGVKHE